MKNKEKLTLFCIFSFVLFVPFVVQSSLFLLTASNTTRSGTPCSRATRAQSSYSGVTISKPSRQPRLAFTSPHGVGTVIA